ncbi:MAG TPA: hypothetical protein P5561_04270 [Candidatus Omnitrophota bacterium]|nr:hypothetical protein [Candidatus Omnitrophota bacterium]HRY85726.1 hypothetical protein [Candidatus Omnitrophota bacterium]
MINVQKEKITAAQIAIFIWASCIAVTVWLFSLIVMGPAHQRVVEAKDKVDILESRLKWVTRVIESRQEPAKVFEYFVAVDRDLVRRFPNSVEKSLIALADYANKFGVRIERVQADKPRKVVTARGIPLGADEKVCTGVSVTFKFKSEYDNLLKYLETLRKVLPAYTVVRNMTAENNFANASRIEGHVDLTLYLLE